MHNYIPQSFTKLIIFLGLLAHFTGCNASTSKHLKSYQKGVMTLPNGESFLVYIAKTSAQQKLGLSKIKAEDFSINEGMLFPEEKMFMRQFWMPETHFDLDVFFLNEDYYVLDIHRGLRHNSNPIKSYRDRQNTSFSKKVFSQHVLELRSDSAFAKKIRPGMLLKFKY